MLVRLRLLVRTLDTAVFLQHYGHPDRNRTECVHLVAPSGGVHSTRVRAAKGGRTGALRRVWGACCVGGRATGETGSARTERGAVGRVARGAGVGASQAAGTGNSTRVRAAKGGRTGALRRGCERGSRCPRRRVALFMTTETTSARHCCKFNTLPPNTSKKKRPFATLPTPCERFWLPVRLRLNAIGHF